MNTTPSHEDSFTTPPTAGTSHHGAPVWGSAPTDRGPTDRGPAGPSGYGHGHEPGSPQRPTPAPGAGLFNAVRRLGIVRPDRGRVVAGVAAGLAHRWGISPIAVRLMFVLLGLLFGAGLFVYGALWLLLPHPDGRIHAEEALRGTLSAGFFGALAATLLGLPVGQADHGPGWVPLVLVGVIVWLLVRNRVHSTRA